MAALNRPTKATYTIHERVTVDTSDNEDHTFCGILFPVKCKNNLPIDRVIINSIAVRGHLGPITVWVSNCDDENDDDNNNNNTTTNQATATASYSSSSSQNTPSSSSKCTKTNKRNNNNNHHRHNQVVASSRHGSRTSCSSISMKSKHWTKIYSKTHKPTYSDYTRFDLTSTTTTPTPTSTTETIKTQPIILRPNQTRGIYIHSSLPGDKAIVYDNRNHSSKTTYTDDFLSIYPGRAHVSETPFGSVPIWGWGSSWRENREFVGRIEYGLVYRLWHPKEFMDFGGMKFRDMVRVLFLCQRRVESPVSLLPDDVLFYVVNMCRWDWMDDTTREVRDGKREMKQRRRRMMMIRKKKKEKKKGGFKDDDHDDDAAAAGMLRLKTGDDEEEEEEEEKKVSAGDCGKCDRKVAAITAAVASTHYEDNDHEDYQEEDDESDDDDDDDESSDDNEEDEWNSDNGYGSYDDHIDGGTSMYFNDDSSDDDEEEQQRRFREEQRRRSWLRSQFARIHVLRALAAANSDDDDADDDDDDEEFMDVDDV